MGKGIYIRKSPLAQKQVERNEKLGELLKDTSLSLRDIGKQLGMSGERVRQLAKQYFPELPTRPRGTPPKKRHYRSLDPVLLEGKVSDEEIAAQLGIKPHSVRSLRQVALKRNGWMTVGGFKKWVYARLREIDCMWCCSCCTVKETKDFPPSARDKTGIACTACGTVRQRQQYHNNPKVREYYKRYTKEHPIYKQRWFERNRERLRGYYQQKNVEYREKQRDRDDRAIRRTAAERALQSEEDLFTRITEADYDIAEKVRSGELTVWEGAREAGIIKKRVLHNSTVRGFYRAAQLWLSPEERDQLRQHLEREGRILLAGKEATMPRPDFEHLRELDEIERELEDDEEEKDEDDEETDYDEEKEPRRG